MATEDATLPAPTGRRVELLCAAPTGLLKGAGSPEAALSTDDPSSSLAVHEEVANAEPLAEDVT